MNLWDTVFLVRRSVSGMTVMTKMTIMPTALTACRHVTAVSNCARDFPSRPTDIVCGLDLCRIYTQEDTGDTADAVHHSG